MSIHRLCLYTCLCSGFAAAQEHLAAREACESNTDISILLQTRDKIPFMPANKQITSAAHASNSISLVESSSATRLFVLADDASALLAKHRNYLIVGLAAVIAYLLFVILVDDPERAHDDTNRSLRQSVLPGLCWATFSILLSIFNKWVMIPAGADFAFPITICTVHMITTTSILWSMRFAKPRLFPGLVAIRFKIIPVLAWPVLGIGLLGAMSLVLSNFSVKHLSVALINMLKTANPAYALVFALILGTVDSRGPMRKTAAAIMLMIGGASITCYGEVLFSAIGLAFFMGGVLVEQLRMIMLKKIFSGNELQWDPLSTVAVVSPVALIILVLPAAVIEGPYLPYNRISSDHQLQQALILNSMVAVALNVSYVRLLDVISPVTFAVCGVAKDLVTAVASLFVVGGIITPLQIIGYLVTLAGFVYYDHLKNMQRELPKEISSPEATKKEDGEQAVST